MCSFLSEETRAALIMNPEKLRSRLNFRIQLAAARLSRNDYCWLPPELRQWTRAGEWIRAHDVLSGNFCVLELAVVDLGVEAISLQ
jgi:hypothetical protein